MSHFRWLAQRRAVSSAVAAYFLILLIAAAVALAGCGLFGGDEPAPEVVDPPASAQASQASSETPSAAQQQQEQQQDAPSEAVAVTTSPEQQQEEQQTQPASEPAQPEEQADPTTYVVQPGDTLAQIANQLGVRIDDLITLNGIQNPDLLRVGQVLQIPGASSDQPAQEQPEQEDAAEQQQEQAEEEQIDPPDVELPTVAVPAATPTRVSWQQFPQPGPEQTTDTIPDPPSNFLQYGAAALPWLHGINEVTPIIELFKAWPMPPLAVGNDRIVLVDATGTGQFSASIVYTDPNSFGAAVPYSNLVVYDPLPGNPSKYRIAYDHAQAYARQVQGIQQLSDTDMTGDAIRDLVFREITCDESGCVSSFYVLSSSGDGYRTVTGPAAQVAEVSAISLDDLTGDGVADLVVEGLAADQDTTARHTFIFTVRGDELVESARLTDNGSSAGEAEDSLEE